MNTCMWTPIEAGIYKLACRVEHVHFELGMELWKFCPYCGKQVIDAIDDLFDRTDWPPRP